jgi:nitroimidazol reductase NimA-like FMN-containing flavoprotein (pyridoxamine 5'-phosphate oxidase superfamily)
VHDQGVDDDRELVEIDFATCFELLRRCTVGRVAMNVERLGPYIVPVNFVLDGEVILFRTDEGTKLRLVEGGRASFQVDSIDHIHHTGWSVLIHGIAHEVDEGDVRRVELEPWAGGPKAHWVRLVPGVVTGRQVSLRETPFDDRGYR